MDDWFIAMRTGTAWSNAGAEKVTIRTSPCPKVALFATRALAHNRVCPSRYRFDRLCGPGSVAGLPVGIATEPAPSG